MSVEVSPDYIRRQQAVLDIGGEIGALIIYTPLELCGWEIEVSPVGNDIQRIHTAVWERKIGSQVTGAALFLALQTGIYTIWSNSDWSAGTTTITGGQVTEVDWRDRILLINNRQTFHPHTRETLSPKNTLNTGLASLLPARYHGRLVSAAPMGASSLIYDNNGLVAWNQMWTDFCDLALAGGPPHRGTLLEPVSPAEIQADPDGYEQVITEIERGLRLVTTCPTIRSQTPGWVGLVCDDETMALWLLRAIVVENVCVRREGVILFFPAGPAFQLDKEIKNVITVVAKTYHYWTEHQND